MRDRLTQPSCANCDHSYFHEESTAVIRKGVRLQPFEHYCLGCKRPRLFRTKGPKKRIPAWCPRRKNPCELRIYGFKSADTWMVHEQLCKSFGKEISPTPHRYEVRYEQTVPFSPHDFWKRCKTEPESELLPVSVTLHEVVEIDDGIRPAFFYKTERGYRITHGFMPK